MNYQQLKNSCGGVLFFLFFLFVCEAGFAQEQKINEPHQQYNVLMLFIDTLRPDHLGCYGYQKPTSPNIDHFAKESILFKNNFSPISYTLASYMSIITSLYPKSHGVLLANKDRLSPRIKTLPEILKLYNYRTAWIGTRSAPHLKPEVGYGRGIDDVYDTSYYKFDKDGLSKTRKFIFDFLKKNRKEKFFLTLHSYHPHVPYSYSEKYSPKFVQEKKSNAIRSLDELMKDSFESIKERLLKKDEELLSFLGNELVSVLIAENIFEGEYAPEKFSRIKDIFISLDLKDKLFDLLIELSRDRMREAVTCDNQEMIEYAKGLYDAMILEYDTEIIGPLMKRLKKLRLYDKTIIILFSDHGEEFCLHGKVFHGKTLYDGAVKSALLMRVPWIKNNIRIDELTQTVDILPTLFDFLNIPIPHHAQGKSLKDLMNKTEAAVARQYVFGQHSAVSFIRSKEWKLLLYEDGSQELFNILADPGEQSNLYLQEKDIASTLEGEFHKWESSLSSYSSGVHPFEPSISKEMQEKIRKSGYWQ